MASTSSVRNVDATDIEVAIASAMCMMEESLENNQETNEEVAVSQKILIPNGLNNEESVTKGLQDILESHGE